MIPVCPSLHVLPLLLFVLSHSGLDGNERKQPITRVMETECIVLITSMLHLLSLHGGNHKRLCAHAARTELTLAGCTRHLWNLKINKSCKWHNSVLILPARQQHFNFVQKESSLF